MERGVERKEATEAGEGGNEEAAPEVRLLKLIVQPVVGVFVGGTLVGEHLLSEVALYHPFDARWLCAQAEQAGKTLLNGRR